MGGAVGTESVLVVGFSAGLIAQLGEALPERAVLVVEEPDVVRNRALEPAAASMPVISRLVACPYQLPGELRAFLSGGSGGSAAPLAAVLPGIEYGVEAAAEAAADRGLPGAGVRAAASFRNKHLLRQVAGAAGIRNPRHALVATPEQAIGFLEAEGGKPCVLKPTSRQGSLGVQLVRSAEEIEAGWGASLAPDEGNHAPDRGVPSGVLIEEAVTGPEFSVEMLVGRGVPRFANVTGKHVAGGRFPVEAGHDVPAPVPDAVTGRLRAATEQLAEATGIHDGLMHAEWILHDGEPVLVECAGRIAGGLIPRLIRRAYGFSLVKAYLETMLGDCPEVPARAEGGAAIRHLMAVPGVVESITGAEAAAALPGVADVHLGIKPGDVVKPLECGWDRIGYVVAQGADARAAAAAADAALALIQVTVA